MFTVFKWIVLPSRWLHAACCLYATCCQSQNSSWNMDVCDIYTTCQLNASRFTSVFVGSILSISSGNSLFLGGFPKAWPTSNLHQTAWATWYLQAPRGSEVFVHRSGRTARAGREGRLEALLRNSSQDFLSCVWVDLVQTSWTLEKLTYPIPSNSEDSFFRPSKFGGPKRSLVSSGELACPTNGKGKSSSQVPLDGMCCFQGPVYILCYPPFNWVVVSYMFFIFTKKSLAKMIHFDSTNIFSDGWQKNTNPIGSMYGYIYLHLPFFTPYKTTNCR